MRESYVEGVASHHGPESWLSAREGRRQALTGEHAGQPLSSVITPSGTPTAYCGWEGNTRRDANASRVLGPAESETLCMRGRSMYENREISAAPATGRHARKGRSGKPCGHNPDVYAAEKSDRPIVPMKLPNNLGVAASRAEEVEGRGLAEEKVWPTTRLSDTEPLLAGQTWPRTYGRRQRLCV